MPTILVVDDDGLTLTTTIRLLKQAGWTIYTANNGEAGLETARHYQPDVILTDIEMPPGITGLEMIDRLRADPQLDSIPVVVRSGSSSDHYRERATSMGIRVLPKPTPPAILLAALKAALTNSS